MVLIPQLNDIDTANPEQFLPILTKLRGNGVVKKDIVDFVDDNLSAYLVDDIVAIRPDGWEAIGVDPKTYTSRWLDQFGDLYFSDYSLSELPDAISVRDFVDYFTVDEIMSNLNKEFQYFVEDYKAAGGRINHLAKKFTEELGYNAESYNLVLLFTLFFCGATNIDLDRLLNAPMLTFVDRDLRQSYYEMLTEMGCKNQFLPKLKSA